MRRGDHTQLYLAVLILALCILAICTPSAQAVNKCLTPATFSRYLIFHPLSSDSLIFVADANSDSRRDIIYATPSTQILGYFKNADTEVSGKRWSNKIIAQSVQGISALFVADLTGTGKQDIILGNDNGVSVYYEDGSVETINADSEIGISSLFAADFNGGNVDIVAAFATNSTIQWYENNGSVWTGTTVTASAQDVSSVYVADLDANGSNDIVAASPGSTTVSWFSTSTGGLTWTEQVISNNVTGLGEVIVADLNGDGFLDVIATSDSGVVIFSANDNSGTNYNTSVVAEGLNKTTTVIAADLNGDGLLDLVVTSENSSTLAWYQNKLSSWKEHVLSTPFINSPQAVFVADVNGDDAYDIVIIGDNQLYWFKETCQLTTPLDEEDDNTVGWAVATGVLGLFLGVWLLIIIAAGTYDFLKKKRKQKARARHGTEAVPMAPSTSGHVQEEEL